MRIPLSVSCAISTGDVTHSSHKSIVSTSTGAYHPRMDTAATPCRCCYQPRYPECPSKQLSPFWDAKCAEVSCNAIGRRMRGVSPSGRHPRHLMKCSSRMRRAETQSSEETESSHSPADVVTDVDVKAGKKGNKTLTADQVTFPIRSGPQSRKWWDPIADVIFPHRRLARRQQLRRNNSLDPRVRARFMHGYPVHPMPGPHMYPAYPPPPPPHPFPYYGMPPHPMHFPPPPVAMHGHPAAYPVHGYYPPPLNADGDDLQSEVSIMDPSFYTSPSHESYRRGSGPPNVPRSGRKKRVVSPPPLIATPPSSFLEEKSHMVEYDSEKEGQGKQTMPDEPPALENDIKGFDSFMMY